VLLGVTLKLLGKMASMSCAVAKHCNAVDSIAERFVPLHPAGHRYCEENPVAGVPERIARLRAAR
jgi:hypothetical protein